MAASRMTIVMIAHARMHAWLMMGAVLLFGCAKSAPPASVPAKPTSSVAAPVVKVAKGRIAFVRGYAQGYQQALRDGRPMMVFFTAPWCQFCHQLEAEAFSDLQVSALSRRFVCLVVDAEQEPNVCREFRVRGYPTIQFITPQGVPLNRLVGKRSPAELVLEMQAALEATAARSKQTSLR